MFHHGARRKLRIGWVTAVGLGAVLSLVFVPRIWSQGPAVGNPNLGMPGSAGITTIPPPATPGIAQVDPHMFAPMDPQTPIQAANDEVTRTREEIKHLTAEREQKRAECQEVEARYKEAERRLADALVKKKQVLLQAVEMTEDELRNHQTSEHTAASPYQAAATGVVPAGYSVPAPPIPTLTPASRSAPPGGVFVPPSPMPTPAAIESAPRWQHTQYPGQQ